MEVMSQPRATPALHIRVPRKPFPPATTTFFLTEEVMTCKVPHEGLGTSCRSGHRALGGKEI